VSGRAEEVRLADLGVLEEIADGGQGKVYRIPARPGELLKRYHPHVCDQLNPGALRRIIARPAAMTAADRRLVTESTAWPTALVTDGGRYVGFLMRQAPERFSATIGRSGKLLELQFLLHPLKPMWRALVLPSPAERRELAKCYVRFFQVLHRYDVIVGDVSMKNFLWTLRDGPAIFALDCDGFRLNGHHPAVPQPQTPDWEDRTAVQGRATLESDRYKLALLVIRVLLADPYLTPPDVMKRPELAGQLGEALTGLVRRAAADRVRPTAEHWLRALDGRPTVVLSSPGGEPRSGQSPGRAGPARPTVPLGRTGTRRRSAPPPPVRPDPGPDPAERPIIPLRPRTEPGAAGD